MDGLNLKVIYVNFRNSVKYTKVESDDELQ